MATLFPEGYEPTNSLYCWIPMMRVSASALNLATFSSRRCSVQALAIQRAPPTPVTINRIKRTFFILHSLCLSSQDAQEEEYQEGCRNWPGPPIRPKGASTRRAAGATVGA